MTSPTIEDALLDLATLDMADPAPRRVVLDLTRAERLVLSALLALGAESPQPVAAATARTLLTAVHAQVVAR